MRKLRLRRLLGCWQVTEWEVVEPRFQPSWTDSKPICILKKSILLAVKVQIVPDATGRQTPWRADSQEREGQWWDQERLLALHPCLLHPELSALLLFDCIIGTCWFKIASSPVSLFLLLFLFIIQSNQTVFYLKPCIVSLSYLKCY